MSIGPLRAKLSIPHQHADTGLWGFDFRGPDGKGASTRCLVPLPDGGPTLTLTLTLSPILTVTLTQL